MLLSAMAAVGYTCCVGYGCCELLLLYAMAAVGYGCCVGYTCSRSYLRQARAPQLPKAVLSSLPLDLPHPVYPVQLPRLSRVPHAF